MSVWENTIYGIVTFIIVWIAGSISMSLGSFVSLIAVIPTKIPFFGPFYGFVVKYVTRATFLIYLMTIIINASGSLILIELIFIYRSNILDITGVMWGILFAVSRQTFLIMDKISTLNVPNMYMYATSGLVKKITKFDVSSQPEEEQIRLIRSDYMTTMLTWLLIVVESYGITIYFAAKLNLFDSKSEFISTPKEAVFKALYFLKFIVGSQPQISGLVAEIINGFYGMCLLIYTVFAISLASKLLDHWLTVKK